MEQGNLPKVNTRKAYMEQLADMMSRSSVDQEEEVSEPGRKTELKTYIVESNSPQLSASQFDKFSISVQDTGIDEIKILNLTLGGRLTQFYLDMADKRFWLLHTHGLADEADRIMNRFISNPKYQIDSTWFSSGMLSKVSNLIGNRFDGAGIDYSTLFDSEEEMEVPMEELKVTVYGYRAFEALKRMADAESVKNYFAYDKVRIIRGERRVYAKDDLKFDGKFSVKGGRSIDDHVALVDGAKSLYKKQMQTIEDFGIGISQKGELNFIEGKPFLFEMENPIKDWSKFFSVFLNSAFPFRLWGLENKIKDGYYQVLAVDLHTGHQVDLEIANNLIRVYLPKGSCGNVVLRLFVNLQHYLDSKITCKEMFSDSENR